MFFVAFATLLISCEKEKDENGVTTKMTATIDNKSWEAELRVTKLQNDWFIITGTSVLGEVLTITVRGKSVGTYNFDASELTVSCLATYVPSALSPNTIYTSTSGKVQLSDVDTENNTISGTFEFTVVHNLTDIKTIKNGVFNNLKYN